MPWKPAFGSRSTFECVRNIGSDGEAAHPVGSWYTIPSGVRKRAADPIPKGRLIERSLFRYNQARGRS
ncbi:hypothetical protein ACYOEI_12060 [Singulisphaera rosea]